MSKRKLLIAGNSTMPSSVGIFNLPPLLTCTPSEWCLKHCYALKGRFLWTTTKEAYYWRYSQSLMKNFAEKMISEINWRRSIKYVRVHISGDFYSCDYIDKWVRIAKTLPEIIFRTNTRRLEGFQKYMRKVFPQNFVVRESTDPTRNSLGIFPQAAIKGTPGSKKFFICKDDCAKCNFYCWCNPEVNVVTSQIR